MSKISLSPSPTGSAVYTIASPAGSTDRTLNLPDNSGELLSNNSVGFRFVQSVQFTSNGTFSKGDYPWLRAIRVRLVGGGGGGNGNNSANQSAGGGGGGAYAESFITDIVGLDASVTVTRGAGGAGGSNFGSVGGNSSFGALVIAEGGLVGGGIVQVAGAGGRASQSTGNLVISGSGGGNGAIGTGGKESGFGGSSQLGGSAVGSVEFAATTAGAAGELYGGGGVGARGASAAAVSGGTGGNGIVIVELYA